MLSSADFGGSSPWRLLSGEAAKMIVRPSSGLVASLRHALLANQNSTPPQKEETEEMDSYQSTGSQV